MATAFSPCHRRSTPDDNMPLHALACAKKVANKGYVSSIIDMKQRVALFTWQQHIG
jgi:hypothetical protein